MGQRKLRKTMYFLESRGIGIYLHKDQPFGSQANFFKNEYSVRKALMTKRRRIKEMSNSTFLSSLAGWHVIRLNAFFRDRVRAEKAVIP